MKSILTLTVNGRPREDLVPDGMLLLDYLREKLGLTGTKQGCDGGECGACTVLVDDEPRLACSTLAAQMQGRRVETIEGLAKGGRMSVLQQQFHEKLGAQCGFCTPGMIMAAEALLRRDPDPSREAIKAALAGNLCRCTGYVKIIESVEAAAHGGGAMSIHTLKKRRRRFGRRAHAADRRRRQSHRQSQIHRRSAARPARSCGRLLRSPLPHARILSIDASAAEALEGVAAVCTGADCKMPFGVLPISENEFPLAREKARYCGDPVAAVAAVDEATAAKAIKLIRVEYEKLPAYFDARKAMAPGAEPIHAEKPNNVLREVHNEFGDAEAGFQAADLVREKTYHFAEVNHVHIEPNATLAEYDPERGHLTAAHHHPGSLLRPPQRRQMPGDGGGAHPGGQALRRRRLRRAHRVPATSRSSPPCWPARRAAPCGCCRRAKKPSSPIAADPRPTSRSSWA